MVIEIQKSSLDASYLLYPTPQHLSARNIHGTNAHNITAMIYMVNQRILFRLDVSYPEQLYVDPPTI